MNIRGKHDYDKNSVLEQIVQRGCAVYILWDIFKTRADEALSNPVGYMSWPYFKHEVRAETFWGLFHPELSCEPTADLIFRELSERQAPFKHLKFGRRNFNASKPASDYWQSWHV